MAKFGTDVQIFADAESVNKDNYGKFSNSRADNLDSSGPIRSIIKLNRDLMATYILTKFSADCLHSIIYKYWKSLKSLSACFFPNSRASNSGCSGLIRPVIELIRDLMGIYIVAKFGTGWQIFADARLLTKSNMANFLIQGQITQTVLVRLDP